MPKADRCILRGETNQSVKFFHSLPLLDISLKEDLLDHFRDCLKSNQNMKDDTDKPIAFSEQPQSILHGYRQYLKQLIQILCALLRIPLAVRMRPCP